MAKEALTIRLEPDTRKALERLAQRESRSMSSYIEWTIKRLAIEQGAYVPSRQGIKAVSE